MSGEINVLSRTQIINVDPSSGTVSVINAGPQGPAGPNGGVPIADFNTLEARVTALEARVAALEAAATTEGT